MFPKGELPVTITLYKNVPFDNTYSDHLYRPQFDKQRGSSVSHLYPITMSSFLNTTKQDGTTKYYPSLTLTGNYNFPYGNGLNTSITLEVPNTFSSANYMKITNQYGDNVMYFFINNVVELNASGDNVTIRCDLELDVIATYDTKILDALDGYPLLTERKHCQRFNVNTATATPYCTDLATNEEIFNGLKPTQVKKVQDSLMNFDDDYYPKVLQRKMNWVYIMFDEGDSHFKPLKVKGVSTIKPTIALPYVKNLQFNLTYDGTLHSYNTDVDAVIKDLWEDGKIFGIKISPYPPFSINAMDFGYDLDSSGNIEKVYVNAGCTNDGSYIYTNCGNNIMQFTIFGNGWVMMVDREDDTQINSEGRNLVVVKPDKPTKTTLRDFGYEPKMLVPPIRKYVIKTQYSDGSEVYPYLIFSHKATSGSLLYRLNTYKTSYVNDLTYSTYINFIGASLTDGTYYYNKEINNGAISTAQYSLPSGKDAMQYFNQTQGTSFVTGKIAQGVAGAISIAGGVALASTGNAPLGATAIRGGIMAVGGVVALANAGASAGAKYTDLANTPDTINGNGASVVHDLAVENTILPYVVEYGLDATLEDIVLDYFYDYGYKVQRCCKFNKMLTPTDFVTTDWTDERIFTRETFNYVKLGEDIRCKIAKGDFTTIVKNKINEILNNGIKLWTFFGVSTITYNEIDNYLFHNTYENPELY